MHSNKNYLLTKYIHPLKKPINISKKLGLRLCNLDLEDLLELSSLQDTIRLYLGRDEIGMDQEQEEDTNYDDFISSFKKSILKFNEYHSNDGYTRLFSYDSLENNEDLIECISSSWVVLEYYSDNTIYDQFTEKEIGEWLGIEEGEGMTSVATNICYLLTCLSSKNFSADEYEGDSFIIEDLFLGMVFNTRNAHVDRSILNFEFVHSESIEENKDYNELGNFVKNIESIKYWGDKLDKVIDKKSVKKINYIGNLLKSAGNYSVDYKLKFIILVSVIELILTHSPNYNRFNVEDSISKQFKLKTITIAKLIDEREDYVEMKKELSEIYSQRSNIAHGNFSQFEKFVKKGLKENPEYPIDIFWKLSDTLRNYVRIVITAYICDPEYIEFLKDN